MRFLFLTQYFPPEVGAPQVRLAAMVKELQRLGHEVEVVTGFPNYPTGRVFPAYQGRLYCKETWQGTTVHRVWLYASSGAGLRRLFNYLSFTVTSILGLLRSKRPDYIFVESPPLTVIIPAVIVGRLFRVPLIFNVADLWPDSIKEMGLMSDGFLLSCATKLEQWSYAKASYVNAVTLGIRTTLIERKGVPIEKILFLPNGVDIDLFSPRPADKELARDLGLDGKKIILYAGTLGFAQGLDVALDAMSIVSKRMPNAVLVFLGAGSDRERLMERTSTMGLTNVRFLDPQPIEFVARLYALADAGFASLKRLPVLEGARPSKIFPIMGSAKPVLYSGAGEAQRLLEDADAGVVTPPGDAAALADAMQLVLADPEYAQRLGANGRRYVQDHLSWSRIIGDWIVHLAKPGREQ